MLFKTISFLESSSVTIFNKVSTESHADTAEKTAQNATTTKAKAEADKDEAKKETEIARTSLTKLSVAADMVLNNLSPTVEGSLSVGETNTNTALDQLRTANNKAKEIVA